MSIEFNHTIIPARDPHASARFLADILGLETGKEWAYFVPVRTHNGVTLDFSRDRDPHPQHYAFLLSDTEFDAAHFRMKRANVAFHASFDGSGRGEISRLYGGRSVYFTDANGRMFELITRPMGPLPRYGWMATRGDSQAEAS